MLGWMNAGTVEQIEEMSRGVEEGSSEFDRGVEEGSSVLSKLTKYSAIFSTLMAPKLNQLNKLLALFTLVFFFFLNYIF